MPDRAKIISQLASKAKMDPSSATTKKDIKALGEIKIPQGFGMDTKSLGARAMMGAKGMAKKMNGSESLKFDDDNKPIRKLKPEPLPTPKDKEEEVEDLLTESEKEMEKQAEDNAKDRANYERIQEQGMSDQGIVNMDQLVDAGKKVYRKVKSKVKKMME